MVPSEIGATQTHEPLALEVLEQGQRENGAEHHDEHLRGDREDRCVS